MKEKIYTCVLRVKRGNLIVLYIMKHEIKQFIQTITHKRTRTLLQSHVVEIQYKNKHVVISIDNAGPLRELGDKKHDEQIKKSIDQIYGEDSTYELKLAKSNVIHERANQVFRTGQKG